MTQMLLLLASLGFAAAGLACLALSQAKPWVIVAGRDSAAPRVRPLRRLGWLCLGASAVLTLLRDGVSFGLLLWPLVLFAAAGTIAMVLTYRPLWLSGLARAFAAAPDHPARRAL